MTCVVVKILTYNCVNYKDNNYYDDDNNNQNGCIDCDDIENETNEYDNNDNGKT